MCHRNPQLDFQGNWAGVSASVSASVEYTATASSARSMKVYLRERKYAAKVGESLKVCYTFKVAPRLSPDTFWVCFRAGESLKDPESDSYGFAIAQRQTTKVI
jgi:hypothetical protein